MKPRTYEVYLAVVEGTLHWYVGAGLLGKRWPQHISKAQCGSRLPLHAAIRKYGPEAFIVHQLMTTTDRAEAFAAEQEVIASLRTEYAAGSYNLTPGGESPGSEASRMFATHI